MSQLHDSNDHDDDDDGYVRPQPDMLEVGVMIGVVCLVFLLSCAYGLKG